jgi:hypothetical protein
VLSVAPVKLVAWQKLVLVPELVPVDQVVR